MPISTYTQHDIEEWIGQGCHVLDGQEPKASSSVMVDEFEEEESLQPEVEPEPDDNHDQPVATMNRNTKGGIDVFPMVGQSLPDWIVRQLQAIGYRWSKVGGLHLWAYYSAQVWGQTEEILNQVPQEEPDDQHKAILLEIDAITRRWNIPPTERFQQIQRLISEAL
jgi:hypothetical protein